MTGIEINIARGRAFRVRGVVVNQTGEAGLSPIQVLAMPRDRGITMLEQARMGAQGRFEVRGLMPGSYTFQAILRTSTRSFAASSVVDVGDRDVDNIVIMMRAMPDVPGQIKLEDSAGVNLSGMRLFLRPAEQTINMMSPNAAVLQDGGFALQNAAEGRYLVNLQPMPDGHYIKSVRIGEREMIEDGVEILPGSAAIQIVLSGKAATVQGVVKNDKDAGVSGATVVLVPDSPKRREQQAFYKVTTTDQAGSYTIKSVDPGDYHVFSWEDIETGSWMDPDVIRVVESKGKKLIAHPGATETAELKVIAGQ